MSASVPIYAPCDGGLVLDENKFTLLDKPGVATRLRNFEVARQGGYRRVNGYAAFGGGSATRPNGATPILGVIPYALGIVVCSGTDVHYTEDGVTWLQINKDTTESGDTEGNLPGLATLSRASQGQASFVVARGTEDHATNPYGVLYIATGPNAVAHFHIDGTGGGRTFTYTEPITAPAAGEWIANHDHHLIIVDTTNSPNEVFYSALDDFDDFAGGLSGSIVMPDQIVGIRSFRENLYIFCERSIYRLVNINDPATLEILPVTGNLGCVDGHTIQEIGGDLMYLAPDGFRTIAGTQRLDDVELGTVSGNIQPLINTIIDNKDQYTFSSAVIRGRNQYRMFYIDSSGIGHGIIGTLRASPDGVLGYQWSELRDIGVQAIGSTFDDDGLEVIYHGDEAGFIFVHDSGSSFGGGSIQAEYQGPDTHFGDLGLLKTLHYFNVSLAHEGAVDIDIRVSFDFNSTTVTQPPLFNIILANAPAIFGSAVFDSAQFGAIADPLNRVPLQGSGHSAAFKFFTDDINPPYIIHGYHVEVMPSGRQ